jgi:hypothetical protein
MGGEFLPIGEKFTENFNEIDRFYGGLFTLAVFALFFPY